MGYAIPLVPYHKGPKKNKQARKCHKPTFDKPTQSSALSPNDESLIRVLAQMSDRDMQTFVEATTYPRPLDVLLVRGENGRPTPVVLADADSRQTHSGMVYVSLDVGGGAPHHVPESEPPIFKPTAVKVNVEPPKSETGEKVIGNIVRKPNGEIVLKFF
jgi:hypothetical protein